MNRGIYTLLLTFLFACAPAVNAQTFRDFLRSVNEAPDSAQKKGLIDAFVASHAEPFIENDSIAYVYYCGKARRVAVPGDANEWNPTAAPMHRLEKTDFFFAPETIPASGRMEYKLWVDSTWILDPRNPRRAMGGYGLNSDVWMPRYKPLDFPNAEDIPEGRLDTIWVTSTMLKQRHPVIIYTPAHWDSIQRLPSIWVTDGSDYLRLTGMARIMNILIFTHKIQPVLGVFIDPRTDLRQDSTNKRMAEYSGNDRYLDFLQKEVQPLILRRYHASRSAKDMVIMGASMGGLISTYAVLTRSRFAANCAAQSPAYSMADSVIFRLSRKTKRLPVRIYIDTGTINDAQEMTRPVQNMLKRKGFDVEYAEYPEGHNWTNWRARIPRILEKYFGARK